VKRHIHREESCAKIETQIDQCDSAISQETPRISGSNQKIRKRQRRDFPIAFDGNETLLAP
jgi:hypothetical protein